MERESHLNYQVIRAARSLYRNRQLLPVIERRIQRAEQIIRSYLILQNQDTVRLGAFQIDLAEEEINLTRVTTDEWEQLAIPDPTDQELLESGDIFTSDCMLPIPEASIETAHERE